MHDLYKELIQCGDGAIVDAAMKCESVFLHHDKALVSLSGGADSDIILDLCQRVRKEQSIEIEYAFFDTGIEYAATKEQLDYLEWSYQVEIKRLRAIKSIPVCCKEYGQPFASKYISMMIERLQNIGFEWDDCDSFQELWDKYGECRSGLRWWTNDFAKDKSKPSKFDIGYRRHLKEFMVENPPWFWISPKCCTYAKKKVAAKAIESSECDLTVVGVRKAEGGSRAFQNKCFDRGIGVDTYRPLFWFSDSDRQSYEAIFNISHSDCYEVWGFKRTGCVGCPYSRNLQADLETTKQYEPKIHFAVQKIFADAYEYTRMFNEFKEWLKV